MQVNCKFTRHHGLWHVLVTPLDEEGKKNIERLEGVTYLILKKDGETSETLLGPMCCRTEFQARYTIWASRAEESPVGYEGDGRYFDRCSGFDDPNWEKV